MQRPALLTRPFVLVALTNLSVCIGGFLLIHFPGFLKDLGAGEAEIGRIMALSPLMGLLLGPFIGRTMDRRGRRVVILAGSVLETLTIGLYFTLDSIGPWLYVVRLLHGSAGAMLYMAMFTYAADVVPAARRTEGLALFGASGLLPMAISSVMGDYILAGWDYRALFAATLGFYVVGLVMALRLRDMHAQHSDQDPPRGIVAAARQSDLMPVWLVAGSFFVCMGVIFTFLKTFVMSAGLGSVGGFFAAYSLVAVTLRLFLGWLPDRIGAKRVLAPAVASYAAGLLLLATATQDVHVLLAGACCGIGHGYIFPILFAMVVTRARDADRGAAMAIYTTLDQGGHLLSGPIFGLLIQSDGYATAFTAAGCVLGAGALTFFVWDRLRIARDARRHAAPLPG